MEGKNRDNKRKKGTQEIMIRRVGREIRRKEGNVGGEKEVIKGRKERKDEDKWDGGKNISKKDNRRKQ